MAKEEPDVSHHFHDLVRYYNNEEFDKAVRSANAILKDIPGDQKALHCKAVCLVQVSKFAEALAVLQQVATSTELLLPTIYALYRSNQYTEIMDMFSGFGGELTLELKELKAQTLYKLERYEECLEMYKELLKKQRDDLDSERQCNYLAVLTQLQVMVSLICSYFVIINV